MLKKVHYSDWLNHWGRIPVETKLYIQNIFKGEPHSHAEACHQRAHQYPTMWDSGRQGEQSWEAKEMNGMVTLA